MHSKFLHQTAALALAAVLIPCAPAQDATTLVPPVRPFRLPARIGVFGEAQITLQQALAMALANNKDITASRIDREITGYNLTGARGLYDPTVGAVSQFLKQVSPVASSLGGSATGAADVVVTGTCNCVPSPDTATAPRLMPVFGTTETCALAGIAKPVIVSAPVLPTAHADGFTLVSTPPTDTPNTESDSDTCFVTLPGVA